MRQVVTAFILSYTLSNIHTQYTCAVEITFMQTHARSFTINLGLLRFLEIHIILRLIPVMQRIGHKII